MTISGMGIVNCLCAGFLLCIAIDALKWRDAKWFWVSIIGAAFNAGIMFF